MSDTSGVSHNSDSGGGRGTWKGEPEMDRKDSYPGSLTPSPNFQAEMRAPPLTGQQLCIMCEVGSQAWRWPGRVTGSLQFTGCQHRPQEATWRLGGQGSQRTGQKHKDVHLREVGKLSRRGPPQGQYIAALSSGLCQFPQVCQGLAVLSYTQCARQQPYDTGIPGPLDKIQSSCS